MGKLLDFLEKWIVLDDVLPILEKVTMRDSAVLMAMLGIYKVALTHPKLGITKDILATRVLPSIIPILIDGNLNMKQVLSLWSQLHFSVVYRFSLDKLDVVFKFNAYMTVTKEMLAQIETEQKRKLEQIEALEREKRYFSIYVKTSPDHLSIHRSHLNLVSFHTQWLIPMLTNQPKSIRVLILW